MHLERVMSRETRQTTILFPITMSIAEVQAALHEARQLLFGIAPTQESKPATALRIHDVDDSDELGKIAK